MDNAPSRPKRTGTREISLFGGLLYCLDCGFAMRYNQEQHRRKNGSLVIYKSSLCGNYARSGRAACSSHIIYTNRLSEIVIADIQQKAAMVECDEQDLLERIGQRKATASQEQLATLQASIRTTENRRAELERLIQSLYEDNVNGKLSDIRFEELSSDYEAERPAWKASWNNGREQEQHIEDVERFIRKCKRYTDLTELTPTILNDLVSKVFVEAPDKSDGQRRQNIHISYDLLRILPELNTSIDERMA